MPSHAARGHAQWSASASARNFACAGAMTMIERLNLPDRESEAAAWGTACHEISEMALRDGRDAVEFTDRTIKTKQHEMLVDDEMAETSQVYLDYVRRRIADYKAEAGEDLELLIEQNMRLDAIEPPFDSGGTGDAILWFPKWKLLEVVDLKGGRGVVVEAVNNLQLRTYGLCAMLTNPRFKAQTIRVTIVQPRAPHKSGSVRSEEFDVVDLMGWVPDLLTAQGASRAAQKAYDTMPTVAWAKEFLSPGDHCAKTFCSAQAVCPALKQRALDAANVWFDDGQKPRISNSPDEMSPEEIASMLDTADLVEGYFKALRAYAHAQAEAGVEIPEYILVDKLASKKWSVDDAEAARALTAAGVEPWTQKLITPAQAIKAAGKENASKLDDLWRAESSGTNLVRADKTTRKPTAPAVTKHFTAE